MPNVLTPPLSAEASSYNSLTSSLDGYGGGGGGAARPVLHLTGSRNLATNEVTVFCRCSGFPSYAHPIIALFVCRDVRHERDHYNYLGQTQPTPNDHNEELVECRFVVADCPPPPPLAQEEERVILTPRSLADSISRGLPEAPVRRGTITQLKLNVYSTNTSSAANGFAGGLQQQDMIGTGFVELERLLEQKDDDTLNRGMVVELRRPAGASRSHSSPPNELLSFAPNFSSPPFPSSASNFSASSSNYTTLHIPHQIPPASAIMDTPLSSSSAASSSSSLYGVPDESLKSVHHTPVLPNDNMHDQHEAFLRRQREEVARAERLGAKPIDSAEIARGNKYELGTSKSNTLLKHQQSRRMCSADECVIC